MIKSGPIYNNSYSDYFFYLVLVISSEHPLSIYLNNLFISALTNTPIGTAIVLDNIYVYMVIPISLNQ